MLKPNQNEPPVPDVVIPCAKLYLVKKSSIPAAGLEFIGPDDKAYFVWLDGRMLPALAQQILDFVQRNPEIVSWKLPKGHQAMH